MTSKYEAFASSGYLVASHVSILSISLIFFCAFVEFEDAVATYIYYINKYTPWLVFPNWSNNISFSHAAASVGT